MGLVPEELQRMAHGWRWSRRPLVPRSAEPWALESEGREFPTAWARTPAARTVRAAIQTYGLKPLVWAETAPRVHGLDVLEGLRPPLIFVSNHTSHLDTPLILCSLPPAWRDRTAVGAAADYFFDAWWRATATAIAFNAFPVERRGTGQVGETPGRLLEGGWNLMLFPEGTRSPDGWAHKFRNGVAHLATTYDVPVVPIGIRGSYAAMPRGRGWPRPGRHPISIRYGVPLRPEAGEDVSDFTERVRGAIGELLDEDATTWFGAMSRAASGATPDPAGPEIARWRRVWESTRPLPRAEPPRAWRGRNRAA